MAAMIEVRDEPIRLLDPGAGVGSLTAAVVERWAENEGGSIEAVLVEADSQLALPLTETLEDLTNVHDFSGSILQHDFVEWASDQTSGFPILAPTQFDVVIMNPPYQKIGAASSARRRTSAVGVEVPNLYAAFVAMSIQLLAENGQIVAITPRSFTNGPYFRHFRAFLLEALGLRRVHVFDSRDVAFADSDVLQENVIFAGTRGKEAKTVMVSSSRSVLDRVTSRKVPIDQLVYPGDPESFLHLAVTDAALEYADQMHGLPCRLSELDIKVSTGPVVDFRVRDHLRETSTRGTVPLIYPQHLRRGHVVWPQVGGRKPNALARNATTTKLLMPAGTYVVVKRFSSKEEKRRIVATVVRRGDLPGSSFGFENHLNVFHRYGEGLPNDVALGIAAFLNTTTVDQYFRQFNGHTQVNATDLRNLRYPTLSQLRRLGVKASGDQTRIDRAAEATIPGFRRREHGSNLNSTPK